MWHTAFDLFWQLLEPRREILFLNFQVLVLNNNIFRAILRKKVKKCKNFLVKTIFEKWPFNVPTKFNFLSKTLLYFEDPSFFFGLNCIRRYKKKHLIVKPERSVQILKNIIHTLVLSMRIPIICVFYYWVRWL